MKFRSILIAFCVFGAFFFSSSAAFAQDVTPPEGLHHYEIDKNHSSVVFRIKHMDVGFVFGMFRGYDGSFVFDEENLEESEFNFTIEANSIFTNNETRDGHLKSPDFFAAEEHEEITFASTKVERVNERTYRITGDMTIRGTTNEITVMADQTGQTIDQADRFRRGFLTTFAVNRMDFGVDEMPDGLGHHVRVQFAIQGFIPDEDDEDEG